jgi:chromosome partitioning protein
MKTIATINFKGGVGKTTVTWCLGDLLANFTKTKTLLFDLDAQMSMTQAVALDADGNSSGKFGAWYDAAVANKRNLFALLQRFLESNLNGVNIDNGFVYRLSDNYHLVPSTEQLYWLELDEMDPGKAKFFVKELMGKVAASAALPKYDYALFDCPPSFTTLSYSVLTNCDLILIPVNPDFFAARGVSLLVGGLHHRIQPHPLPKLAVFVNRARTYGGEPTKAAQAYIANVKEACENVGKQIGRKVHFLDAWVPDRASIRDAISSRATPAELVPRFRDLWDQAKGVLAK